jgi:hypothetical protein
MGGLPISAPPAPGIIVDRNTEHKGGVDVKLCISEVYPLTTDAIRFADGAVGVYFLALRDGGAIGYPFRQSRLVYIGMSESRQNSIGNRLRSHLSGRSGNAAICNYARARPVVFSYCGIELLRALGTNSFREIESFFLDAFASAHGAFPICNNQCGWTYPASVLKAPDVEVDWTPWE